MRNPYDRIEEFLASGNVITVNGPAFVLNVTEVEQWLEIASTVAIYPEDMGLMENTLHQTSIDSLFAYGLQKELERDVSVFSQIIRHFTEEGWSSDDIKFCVLKDLRCAEKDRSCLLLEHRHTSHIPEDRLQGFMTDPQYGGYRIDKHTVDRWRFERIDWTTHPQMHPIRVALGRA